MRGRGGTRAQPRRGGPLAMISPSNSFVGLTRAGPGVDPSLPAASTQPAAATSCGCPDRRLTRGGARAPRPRPHVGASTSSTTATATAPHGDGFETAADGSASRSSGARRGTRGGRLRRLATESPGRRYRRSSSAVFSTRTPLPGSYATYAPASDLGRPPGRRTASRLSGSSCNGRLRRIRHVRQPRRCGHRAAPGGGRPIRRTLR